MTDKEIKEAIYNMNEQELNEYVFFALKEMTKKCEGLQAELEKKDKIIDEMAKVLADYKYEEIICMEVDCEHIELQNEGTCIGDKACIKEYFKKKVEVKDE